MKLKCIFGLHRLYPIHVYNYTDVSYGGVVSAVGVTSVCHDCGRIKSQTLDFSNVSLEDLQSAFNKGESA